METETFEGVTVGDEISKVVNDNPWPIGHRGEIGVRSPFWNWKISVVSGSRSNTDNILSSGVLPMIGTDVHTNIARKKVTHPAAPLVLIPRISWAKDLSDGAKPVMCQAPPRIVISEHYGGSDHEVRCAVCSRWPAPDDHVWRPKFGQPSDGVQRVRDAPKSTIARPPSCPGRKAEIIAGTCSRILLLTPKVTGRPHMVTATT